MISTTNTNIPVVPPLYTDPSDSGTSSSAHPYKTQHYYNPKLAKTLEQRILLNIEKNPGRKVTWVIKAFGTEKKLRLMLNSAKAYIESHPADYNPAVVSVLVGARFGKSGPHIILYEASKLEERYSPKLDLTMGTGDGYDEPPVETMPAQKAGLDNAHAFDTVEEAATAPVDLVVEGLKATIIAWYKGAESKQLMDQTITLSNEQVTQLQTFITANNIAGKVRTTGLKLIKL